jgi:hypothetical protein
LIGITQELDLSTQTNTGEAWDCSLRFKIVQLGDRNSYIHVKNHFSLVNGVCPGPTFNGTYCAAPENTSFGYSVTIPAGTTPMPTNCLDGRTIMNGSYCNESYAAACPPEPYFAPNGKLADGVNPDYSYPWDSAEGLYNSNYPNRPAILRALRRFLPESDWDINVSRGCVVQKTGVAGCYPAQTNGQTIVSYDEYYFGGTEVNNNVPVPRYAGCGVANQPPCAAYMTLCIRH